MLHLKGPLFQDRKLFKGFLRYHGFNFGFFFGFLVEIDSRVNCHDLREFVFSLYLEALILSKER